MKIRVTILFLCLSLAMVNAHWRTFLKRPGSRRRCPSGFTLWGRGCYRYFNYKCTWDSAARYCSRFRQTRTHKVNRAHLVTIDSARENNFLLNFWRRRRGRNTAVWIGYNDKRHEGKFVTQGGCLPRYKRWDRSEPNNQHGEDCATMWKTHHNRDNGAWNDLRCTTKLAFICKISL
ncbi:alpha-N-acetylgalactosamine-specific lectin-like [Apostichopus japonicus]|uniref:alpha-N-acetylgalactosamine-specific lectin-like n=1 Tax=Stichopus japonicus TaxID=307972 RepID=UPI003AB18EAE